MTSNGIDSVSQYSGDPGDIGVPLISPAVVVAISLSEFASKTDEIFKCKKHTIHVDNLWSYIFVIKVRTKKHHNMHQQTT